jgi:hypothetical protein
MSAIYSSVCLLKLNGVLCRNLNDVSSSTFSILLYIRTSRVLNDDDDDDDDDNDDQFLSNKVRPIG